MGSLEKPETGESTCRCLFYSRAVCKFHAKENWKKKKKTPCKLQNKSSLLVKGGEFKRGRAWEGGRKEILNGILFSELYQLANISYKRKKEGRNSMH